MAPQGVSYLTIHASNSHVNNSMPCGAITTYVVITNYKNVLAFTRIVRYDNYIIAQKNILQE